jgi:AcrR family transcriptional regulator
MLKRVPQQGRSRVMVDTILAAATRVLNARPLGEMSTNEVSEVAGISIGSLYQYFDSKQAIIESLLERHQHHSIALASTVFTQCGARGITVRYREVLRELLALHERDRTLHLNFLQFTREGPVFGALEPAREHACLVARALADEFPHLSPDECKLHAQVLMHVVHTLVHGTLALPLPDRDQRVLEHFDAFASSYQAALGAYSPRTASGLSVEVSARTS